MGNYLYEHKHGTLINEMIEGIGKNHVYHCAAEWAHLKTIFGGMTYE